MITQIQLKCHLPKSKPKLSEMLLLAGKIWAEGRPGLKNNISFQAKPETKK